MSACWVGEELCRVATWCGMSFGVCSSKSSLVRFLSTLIPSGDWRSHGRSQFSVILGTRYNLPSCKHTFLLSAPYPWLSMLGVLFCYLLRTIVDFGSNLALRLPLTRYVPNECQRLTDPAAV